MTKINDGGPAFPCAPDDLVGSHGMTLRDWFAGQAISGLFRHDGWLNTCDGSEKELSFRAYRIADAMIAAREVKP